MFAIYALVDPIEDYKVCYVGMSSDITERYIQHLRCTDKNPAKNEWIQSLRERGYVPTLRTLEVVESEAQAFSREAYWIHFYKGLHMPLTNTHIPPINLKKKEYAFNNALRVPGPSRKQTFIQQYLANHSDASISMIIKAAREQGITLSQGYVSEQRKLFLEQENAS